MERVQRYSFGFADSLLAELAGVPLDALHRDVDAICRAADAAAPLAERLGVDPPRPRLGGFAYNHVSALGAEVVFAEGSEPNVVPMIRGPEDIDSLAEPGDYLSRGTVARRLELLEDLRERRPDAAAGVGHDYEGPVTTAVLLMGQDFLVLPYDDPGRARRLLEFSVESALNYARAVRERLGRPVAPGSAGIPDDFAGMFAPDVFAELVVPSWERMYAGQGATTRRLHSELLREEHLPYLAELRISEYDPSADQFLTPEILRDKCPVPFTGRIQSWDLRDNTPGELVRMYRRIAACEPTVISFYMTDAGQEENIAALLQVAAELAGE